MKKNTAGQVVVAQLASKTDGSAVTTGPTSVYLSGDGGLQTLLTTGSPEAQHLGNGVWAHYPSAAQTNFDHVAFTFINSNAVPVTVQVWTSFPQTGDSYARIGPEIGSPSATLTRDLFDLLAAVANNFARLGAPANASIAADIAAVKNVLPAALSGGRMDCAVNAMANNVITAAVIATDAIDADALAADAVTEIQSGLATASALSTVETNVITIGTYVDTEVGAIKAKTDNLPSDPASASTIAASFTTVNTKLDTIDDYVDTEVGAVKAVTDKLNTTLESIGSPNDYVFTAAALSQAPTSSAPSAAVIADAVWDEARAGHVGAGTFGEGVASVQGAVTGAVGSVTGSVGSVTGLTAADVGAIRAKTDNLPVSPAATGDIPSAATIAAAVWATVVDGTNSAIKLMRGFSAALLGKVSGGGTTTMTFRDAPDSKDVIEATVDADGNRTAITLDLN